MPQIPLILASSSPFRRELMDRLHLDYQAISPDIDESQHDQENPVEYVKRLALEKAEAIANDHPDSVVIGSDQCAYLDGEIMGKPGNHQKALIQLQKARLREVIFYTGVAVIRRSDGFNSVDCVEFRVGFRDVTDEQLEHYLSTEQPYHCAGSFKSEGYGICLFQYMRGDDPTALVGLPLIRLVSMLEDAGIKVI